MEFAKRSQRKHRIRVMNRASSPTLDEVEGVFVVLKEDFRFRRSRRRGIQNAKLEFLLLAIGLTLSKYHKKIPSDRLVIDWKISKKTVFFSLALIKRFIF